MFEEDPAPNGNRRDGPKAHAPRSRHPRMVSVTLRATFEGWLPCGQTVVLGQGRPDGGGPCPGNHRLPGTKSGPAQTIMQ